MEKSADDWYNEGIVFYKKGKYEEAITCLNKAIKLNPNNADAWAAKGGALAESDMYNDAIECCDKSLAINPKNEKAWNNKGVSLAGLKKYDEAKKCFGNALKFAAEKNNKREIAFAEAELARFPIVVPTNAGFKYIFSATLRNPAVVFEKAIINKFYPFTKTRKEIDENLVKFFKRTCLGIGIALPAGHLIHEGIHAGTAVALGGKSEGLRFELGTTYALYNNINSFESKFIIALAPALFEALAGLYLMKLGLSKKNPTYFGYGLITFTSPTVQAVGATLQRTDFASAAYYLKKILINSFSSNPEFAARISAIPDAGVIFLLAAAIYGTAFLGVKYIPKINEELITARHTRKLLHEIKKKDYFLYEALGQKFFWRADRLRDNVMRKIMGPEKYEEYMRTHS